MITNAFLQLGDWISSLILVLFPVWTPSILADLVSYITTLFGYTYSLDFLFPISELFICLIFIFYFEALMFGMRLLLWVLRFLPFFKGAYLDDKGTVEIGFDKGGNRFTSYRKKV